MLKPYKRINFRDHVPDKDTGEIIQQGTPLSANNMRHIEDGIESAINELVNLDNSFKINAEDLVAHNTAPATHPDIRTTQSIYEEKLKLLEDTVFSSGIQDNRTVVAFTAIDSIELLQGNYNAVLQRIECTKGV